MKDLPREWIELAIDKAIASGVVSKYCEALRVIKRLKEEFGDCNCRLSHEQQSGIMSTPAYVCIQFTQCMSCKSYKFRQDQIIDLIEKSAKKKELVRVSVKHDIHFYK
jgi:hypothetical protein